MAKNKKRTKADKSGQRADKKRTNENKKRTSPDFSYLQTQRKRREKVRL